MKIKPICAVLLALSVSLAAVFAQAQSWPTGTNVISTAASNTVALVLAKTSLAHLSIQSVLLLAHLPPPQRPVYATALVGQVAQTRPTALITVAASLSKAYPELAPAVALAAAKACPDQLPDLVRALVAAAPKEISATLTAVAQAFPGNQAEIAAAASRAFPRSRKAIEALVSAAVAASSGTNHITGQRP